MHVAESRDTRQCHKNLGKETGSRQPTLSANDHGTREWSSSSNPFGSIILSRALTCRTLSMIDGLRRAVPLCY